MTLTDLLSGGTWIYALLVLVAAVAYWYLSMPRDVPPGPRGLPLVGFLPFLGFNPPAALSKLSEKYGGIVSLYLGSRFVVVLNDAEVLREALVKQSETFSGRPQDLSMSAGSEIGDKYSLILNDGPFFMDHRRFALHILRDLGFGKSRLEPLVLDEIHHFMTEMKRHLDITYDLRSLLTLSVANNITLMVLGRRFDYDDPWMLEFTNHTSTLIRYNNSVGLLAFFPWLKNVPGVLWCMGQHHVVNAEKAIFKLIGQLVKEHKSSDKWNDDRDNYFHAFMAEQKDRKKNEPSDDTFSDDALVNNIRLFLAAGSETTSTTLIWFLIYMMTHVDVQKKVQREIDDVIGTNRLPSCQDQSMTPYTLATIAEVQRVSSLVPLSVPHRNKQECKVHGYRIPKDTFILANLWHAHNDYRHFQDPATFRPERHLDANGKFVKPENMVVFSLGKRQCLGEPLARMELYLYVTALMQTFDFHPPDGGSTSLDAQITITRSPKSFATRIQLRR